MALMPKKKPQRQCMGCGERKEKQELIRVVRTPEGEICLDATGRKNGRGAYLCRDVECLKKARKKHSLERCLEVSIPEGLYEVLEEAYQSIGTTAG